MEKESLPSYEHVVFNHTYLELSLVQLRYPPVQRFSDESYMVGIKEAIANDYPLVSTEQGMNIIVTPQGVNQTPGAILLRFTSIDSRWSVILSADFVSLETREYTDINDFSERFASILSHIENHFQPRHQLRIGLRYINEFRHPDGDKYETWCRLLSPKLLGSGVDNAIGGKTVQTIAEILTEREDGKVLLRHGFLNGSTVVPAPTKQVKTGPFYLLDIDYYDETPVKFDIEIPVRRMISYNSFLYDVFRWSMDGGDLYQQMRG